MQQLDRALDGSHEINCLGLGLKCSKSMTSRMGIEHPRSQFLLLEANSAASLSTHTRPIMNVDQNGFGSSKPSIHSNVKIPKNPLILIMETNKFNGKNYNDWLRNLRIVLDFKNQGYILDKPLPTTLPEGSSPEERITFEKWLEDNRKRFMRFLISILDMPQQKHSSGPRWPKDTTHKSAPAVLVVDASTSKAKGKRAGCWKRKKEKGKVFTATASAEGAPTALTRKGKGKWKVGGSQRSKAKERGIERGSAHNSSPTQLWKMTKRPFVGQNAIANSLLDLIHTNVCGLLNTPTRGGYSYFITFTNDHSRYGYVYLTRYKFEAFGRFKEYRLEGYPTDSRQDEVLLEESSEVPQQNDATSFESSIPIDDPPKGVKPVGCKWVYKHKLGAEEEVTAFKARLVAKGYTQ
ncbi:hypothetical protein Sango_1166600 [Sesamum angolense]|uniref:Reverse transcriptase Ty1/copia-type domain-containing protein n=1 Tax=Sesamum angolense TaxID=2727404 RepID=A0AAE1WW24_9LAMI|nr:hypothetical protein Sango_1166600 [Sesamum angolense]